MNAFINYITSYIVLNRNLYSCPTLILKIVKQAYSSVMTSLKSDMKILQKNFKGTTCKCLMTRTCNYRLLRKIGSGSFGYILLAESDCNEKVAIKFEKIESEQLYMEFQIYRTLNGGVGIPCVRTFVRTDKYNALVMELLGPSLEDLFNFCQRQFTTKTILMLADQMIDRLEYVHEKGYIHRDLKPENFVMGLGRHMYKVYIIDFGLAKQYIRSGVHISYRDGKHLGGTARYASVNAHLGIELSRRDDLEALGYVLIYFKQGSLPWQGMKSYTKAEKYEKICELKLSTPIEKLCNDKNVEFFMYMKYCQNLKFEEQPNYLYLRKLLNSLFEKFNYKRNYIYDWNLKHKISKNVIKKWKKKSAASAPIFAYFMEKEKEEENDDVEYEEFEEFEEEKYQNKQLVKVEQSKAIQIKSVKCENNKII